MDFADILLNRFNSEVEMKKQNSVLVCFSNLETGKILCRLATYITRSKSEKVSITLLYFISKAEEMLHSEEMAEYQHKIISDLLPSEERDKITLRLFVKSSDDYLADILKTCEEQKCNLILPGMSHNDFDSAFLKKYGKLKNDPVNSEAFILDQFEYREAKALKIINALFSRSTISTGLFIDNGVTEFRKVFIPILHKTDMHIFTYLYRIAQRENIKIMIWDAIGIIQSEPKIQKFFQFILKKTEGHIYLWDNDKKIGCDFIKEQDLIISGTEGWSKLISTPLQWTDFLPSTLIIKEQTN